MKVGRRLAIKLLNASKFALADLPEEGDALSQRARPRDARAPGARSSRDATESFEAYDYARALQRTETFFWRFCDDYLELVKGRRYDRRDRRRTAGAASVSRALRLLAVGLPAPVRAVPAVRRRGGLVVVAGTARSTARVARRGRADGARVRRRADGRRARGARARASPPTCCARCARPSRRRAGRCARRSRACVVHDTAERLDALELGVGDLRQAGSIERIETARAARSSPSRSSWRRRLAE